MGTGQGFPDVCVKGAKWFRRVRNCFVAASRRGKSLSRRGVIFPLPQRKAKFAYGFFLIDFSRLSLARQAIIYRAGMLTGWFKARSARET
jgi:hypothetical protein